jgi:hypothetical protein
LAPGTINIQLTGSFDDKGIVSTCFNLDGVYVLDFVSCSRSITDAFALCGVLGFTNIENVLNYHTDTTITVAVVEPFVLNYGVSIDLNVYSTFDGSRFIIATVIFHRFRNSGVIPVTNSPIATFWKMWNSNDCMNDLKQSLNKIFCNEGYDCDSYENLALSII